MMKGLQQRFYSVQNLMKGRNVLSAGSRQRLLAPASALDQGRNMLFYDLSGIQSPFPAEVLIYRDHYTCFSPSIGSQYCKMSRNLLLQVESELFQQICATHFHYRCDHVKSI